MRSLTRPTRPVWLAGSYAARPPLAGDAECDVCVIGGGIGGIATAWGLCSSGLSVLIVEQRTVASGASGRNAGFLMGGAAPMYDQTRALWGRDRAARLYRATLAGQREIRDTAQQIGASGLFRPTGLLRLATTADEAQAVQSHYATLAEDGFPGELVPRGQLPGRVRHLGILGLLTPNDGTVQPASWVRALASAAEEQGVTIAERTGVTAPPAVTGDEVTVKTDRGQVRAGHAVIAVDGDLQALVPSARHVRCRRLNMLATAPVAENILPVPIYARYGHEWAQQLPDGRIAAGGFSDVDGESSWTRRACTSVPVQELLDDYLRHQLQITVRVTHRWAGLVGYADSPLPTCGPVDGTSGRIIAMGGYSGTGHIQAWIAAKIASQLVTTGTSPDLDLYQSPATAG